MEVRRRPEESSHILSSFKTEDDEINDFVNSVKAPSYLLPAILIAFSYGYNGKTPRTLSDLVSNNAYSGTLFALENGDGYKFHGVEDGMAVCTADNSLSIVRLDLTTKIKWIF